VSEPGKSRYPGNKTGEVIMIARAFAVTLALGLGLTAGPVEAAMTAEQVKKLVEEQSRGKVLKIAPLEMTTLKAFAVTVMNAGGNANHAFQVYTVIIDAETGTIVPEQRLQRHY
jgi:uncharacterized membrane protein YkoI